MNLLFLKDICRRIDASAAFQRVTIGVIVFAAALIGFETNTALVAAHKTVFLNLDRAVLTYFVFELAVRIGASGRDFFRGGWNWFDLVIVAVCFLPSGGYMAAVRLLRVLRVLRLLTAFPKLQILVSALFKSLPSMGYVILLMAILFYVYAVVGVKLFSAADPAHFGDLGKTFVTLFQVVTLEGWADLMWAHRPAADPSAVPWAAAFYFVTFILTGTMITLNLLIGVIINSMQESHKEIHIAELVSRAGAPDARSRLENIELQLEKIREDLDAIRHGLSAGGPQNKGKK